MCYAAVKTGINESFVVLDARGNQSERLHMEVVVPGEV
jgi:hypothetical protein